MLLNFILIQFKTQEVCEKVVKTKQMCNSAFLKDTIALKFIPNHLKTQRCVKKLLILVR